MLKYLFLFMLFSKSLVGCPALSDETVVCVHGFMRTSKSMSRIAASLEKEGWAVERWSYPSRHKYIEEHAQDLVERLNQIVMERPGKPISFVTHSMGGLIVRCALNDPDCPSEAKQGRAVLIAPPNRGSVLARKLNKYALPKTILGKKAGSQLMTTLPDGFDALGDFPSDMPVLVIAGTAGINPLIAGPSDGKVGLRETCLNTPHFRVKSFSGHSWICQTPTVIKKTGAFLRQRVLTHSS